MEIIHHIGFNSLSSIDLSNAISELNIKSEVVNLPKDGGMIISFDISESDTLWASVFELLKKYKGFEIYRGNDIFDTIFSDQEIRNAEWLRLIPTFDQGYPQPEGNWPFEQFSLVEVCPSCGIYKQDNPLRMKKEPSLSGNSFMSFIGKGEIFATKEVFSRFQENQAKGYESWDVIIHKTEKPSEKVHQIFVLEEATPGLLYTEEMRKVGCQKCGTVKYYPHRNGIMYLKRESLISDMDFVRTSEWFGIGLNAYQGILVSNRIAQLILDNGWQGVQMKVVGLV